MFLNAFTYPKKIAEKLLNKFGKEQKLFLFIIDFDCEKSIIIPLELLDNQVVKFEINQKNKVSKVTKKIHLEKYPLSFLAYKKAFDLVQKNIIFGNSFLVNLTCETPISTNLTLQEIFEVSDAKYKLFINNKFVCFSPETFIKIDKSGKISTFPMKGTIDANLPNAKEILLNDKKEFYEHTTIVDLMRNDLSQVSDKVWVEKFRYIDTIKKQDNSELLQVSSQISGSLCDSSPADTWKENLGEIIFKLLPAGSISGAPKDKTIEIIKEAEKYTYNSLHRRGAGGEVFNERNYYTGIFGVFDGETLDSGVMIRFIEQTADGLVFKSGGGITANSIAEKEYEEMIQKIYVPII